MIISLPHPKPKMAVELQSRDLALLRSLFNSRVMGVNHVTALHFDGNYESAKKRLQKLKAAGVVADRPRRTFELSVLFLTRKGLEALREGGVLNEYPPFDLPALERRARVSDLTIQHELEVMDVKTAFYAGIKAFPRCCIEEFSTWPQLYEFGIARSHSNGCASIVRPDGFIRVSIRKKFVDSYFLEVDRSTKVLEKLVAQALCYREYFSSGGFAIRNGGTRERFKEFPFRVLIVLKSADRRNNLAEGLLRAIPPVATQICLSTMAEVKANPLGAIWIQPKDYRTALASTRFDPERNRAPAYCPQPERNSTVDARVPKFSLLSES